MLSIYDADLFLACLMALHYLSHSVRLLVALPLESCQQAGSSTMPSVTFTMTDIRFSVKLLATAIH